MGIKIIRCGEYANESERTAVLKLQQYLNTANDVGDWYIFTNLAHSVSHDRPSEEIDILAVGSTGVIPIEVKHWDNAYLRANDDTVKHEAEKINLKAKKVAGKLRELPFNAGFISGKFLLTRNNAEAYGVLKVNGIPVSGLKEFESLLNLDGPTLLMPTEIYQICQILVPRFDLMQNNRINQVKTPRSFEFFTQMIEDAHYDAGFHKIFSAKRLPAGDRVKLHLYDLSAKIEKNAREIAKREFEVLQKLQKLSCLPSLMDSFQDAPSYPGELCYFSYTDSQSPSLAERAKDDSWGFRGRVEFAVAAMNALQSFHSPIDEQGITIAALYRNLTPTTIRVRSTNTPLFTDMRYARLTNVVTLTSNAVTEFEGNEGFTAPEVLEAGRHSSTVASDVYGLCASLLTIFDFPLFSSENQTTISILKQGTTPDPKSRHTLALLIEYLTGVIDPIISPPPALPDVKLWDDQTIFPMGERRYRVIKRLGEGGFGITFKVMEVSKTDEETTGPYVAKTITNFDNGKLAAEAYNAVRPHVSGDHLAGVLEVVKEPKENEAAVLLRWLPGEPISDYSGVLPLYLDNVSDESFTETIRRWLIDLCHGLGRLHNAGFVHGDVTPRNIIVYEANIALTDYDLAVKIGCNTLGGTPLYCSPETDGKAPAHPSDDLFGLAASFFEVLAFKDPFLFPDGVSKSQGLNWNDCNREEWNIVSDFLDKATHPDRKLRFQSASEAIAFLETSTSSNNIVATPNPIFTPLDQMLTENEVPWFRSLLQSYPDSSEGNQETRGLDSEFARLTYVETELDSLIAQDIKDENIQLVILCGNAGDGKTAFLQNLAKNLGHEIGYSKQRLWNFTLTNGIEIYANLDGSAAYLNRSATDLLDECLSLFKSDLFPEKHVRLLAINDGPLLSWISDNQESYLAQVLEPALLSGKILEDTRIRFVNFNRRSLVGGLVSGQSEPSTMFLEKLLDRMVGEPETWLPCKTCISKEHCTVQRSITLLTESEKGERIRQRLTRSLQAIHQQGEIHITARNLRAALEFIFFGRDFCQDIHKKVSNGEQDTPYFDRAFSPNVPRRQGDLLHALLNLDPALESDPVLDRELLKLKKLEPDCKDLSLASLRRKAYFEWTTQELSNAGVLANALDLAGGEHLEAFLRVGTGAQEQVRLICYELCQGISRLDTLPDSAFPKEEVFDPLREEHYFVPLKISPRTPVETAFWVRKPFSSFSLSPESSHTTPGIETLHTHVNLRYEYRNGGCETLRIGAKLFHLLMELKEGYQITDTKSDDVFAHLSLFKQLLSQEGGDTLYARNPMTEADFQIGVTPHNGVQRIVIRSIGNSK